MANFFKSLLLLTYARHLLGIFILLALTGCASNGFIKQMDELPADSFYQVELEQVPFFPQTEYHCGPAALATVLSYWQVPVVPDDLVDEVYTPAKQGSFQVELVAATRQRGLLAYEMKGSLQQLLAEITAGHPVLVMLNLGYSWYPQWHYAVVVGFEWSEKQVVLRSEQHKRYKMPLALFGKTWSRAKYWGLVALPPDRLPASANPLAYLKAAQSLEQVNQREAAIMAYQTALKTWDHQPIALLGLGNAHYANQQWQQSVDALMALVKEHPHHTVGWNNLSYVLATSGCQSAAQQALACGLAVQPESSQLLATQQEIQALTVKKRLKQCPKVECDRGRKLNQQ
ncbi:PA2778 family cysteine peptidase [Spartinivicinus poritis]|uniref:PA2778 family cysteine peptidase n=1 Tax=Spartinivicinus poritis TaxID=2994640 RepID=A0ABT5UDP4_9GAMM|nr:PA2778 family cysteine peptidase [Spartinivicinus sp. A2-2]MDE1464494.1 PA2778 family cysteine peptidase [Spartinivicinus sp. A2-2]